MDYKIVMPQLSDSMEEGTLVSWKVKEGDRVKAGDTIAEVESDKAIMEIQTFKDGVVEKLLLKEGEAAKVGTVIAIIKTEESSSDNAEAKSDRVEEKKSGSEVKTNAEKSKKEPQEPLKAQKQELKPQKEPKESADKKAVEIEGVASPKAKALALKYGIDIEKLQKEGKLAKPAHAKDIEDFYASRYFSPKALKLLKEYQISLDSFKKGKKYSQDDILEYIQKNNIPLIKKLSTMQKNIIATVTKASTIPVYHIYDNIDATLILSNADKKYTVTLWLIKLFAKALMENELFRATLKDDKLEIFPNASIAVAMANDIALYMPVFKECNKDSIDTLAKKLKDFKSRVKEGRLLLEDMSGSTFAISNLGMTGIERFDAMINKNDSAIAAIGAIKDNKISVTLTIDHRIINGWQGAKFMQTLKALAKDKLFFKDIK